MNWKTHKKLLLEKPEFRKALAESELELQIAKAVIEARLKAGLSQTQLAKKLNTKQSVISRVENAGTTPSLSFLKKIAAALNLPLRVQLG